MHFDLRLWRMTQGLRGHMALSVALGLAAVVGIPLWFINAHRALRR